MGIIKRVAVLTAVLLFIAAGKADAQVDIYKNGERINTITTAVPFLRINPDARSGGMGDVGVAASPDANGLYLNPSKMAFIDNPFGLSVSYTPWLTALVNDIYLASVAGYYKVGDNQTLAMDLRYFSLGQITFTDEQANTTGEGRPNEFAFSGHYARALSQNFSAGVSLRFIYSNLASGQEAAGVPIKPGIAGAGDISFFYTKPIKISDRKATLNVGLNLSNIGSKISYTGSAVKDFIPANLGLGVGLETVLDDYHQINVYADINRLLVPTPDPTDSNFEWRTKSTIAGIFGSFSDAPGGGKEELREFIYSVGAEYWYDSKFALRFGYFYEHPQKGNRQFLSAGVGLKYNVFGLNFSYLIPTSPQKNPLDNTLRFNLLFNFAKADSPQGE